MTFVKSLGLTPPEWAAPASSRAAEIPGEHGDVAGHLSDKSIFAVRDRFGFTFGKHEIAVQLGPFKRSGAGYLQLTAGHKSGHKSRSEVLVEL